MAVIHVGSVECVTVSDACALLEVTPHRVRELVRTHKLRRVGTEAPILIERSTVEKYRKDRGFWNRFGVKGGKPAAVRAGVWEDRG